MKKLSFPLKSMVPVILGILILILVIALLGTALKFFSSPTASHDYPYVDEAIFTQKDNSSYIGTPCYVTCRNITQDADMLIVDTAAGSIALKPEQSADYPDALDSASEIFLIYQGWDDALDMPWGYYLGAANPEGQLIDDIPAYTEAVHLYQSQAPISSEITPTPVP